MFPKGSLRFKDFLCKDIQSLCNSVDCIIIFVMVVSLVYLIDVQPKMAIDIQCLHFVLVILYMKCYSIIMYWYEMF